MKYVLIRGGGNEGKSTTIDAVCRLLKPEIIERLNPELGTVSPFDLEKEMHNGCFILTVGGKIVLVSAGATTEHGHSITMLVKLVFEIKGRLDFAIVAMKSYERKDDFDTPIELKDLGELIKEVSIYQVPGEDYKNSRDWLDRVNGIVDVLRQHGLLNTGELVEA